MANNKNTTSSYNRRSNYKKRTYENNQHQEIRQDNQYSRLYGCNADT